MPFNIADFNAELTKSSVAYPSHFEGWILGGPGTYSPFSGIPGNVLRNSGMPRDGMRFRIESLNMPGRTLTTLDQNYHGPTRSIPYRFTQQPVTMTIILSKDMREREVFMRWQDFFVGNSRNNVNFQSIPAPYDTRYYQEGVGIIKIVQFSYSEEWGPEGGDFEVQNEITLNEAYPISVHDIAMDWASDGYARLQVEIKYRSTTENNLNWSAAASSQQEKVAKQISQYFKDTPK